MTEQAKSATQFCVDYRQFLDADGRPLCQLPALSSNADLLLRAYKNMVLTRALDKKAVALQRTGQMGTYAEALGQEAIGTAIGYAMNAEDVFVPAYRDQATQIIRGVQLEEILAVWGGSEQGSDFQGPRRDLPNCIPVATQISHAAGVATALKIRHQGQAVVASCGDGATSRGDFYEGLNVAGAWQLPMVVVVNNNQWAISVRRQYQTASASLAQKAIAAGIPGVQVDGNDIIALHDAICSSLARARKGKGATLIEAVTYRLCDHTTADDATRYRSTSELNEAWAREPVKRLQSYLHDNRLWDADQEKSLQSDCRQRVEEAARAFLAREPQAAHSMFRYLYAEWPAAYAFQEQLLEDKLARQSREDSQHEH